MDKTLKALHLRLDSTSKSLTKNAISQLIIKILYQNENPLSKTDIQTQLSSVLKTDIEQRRVDESIDKLLEENEINFSKKRYTLTRSNRRIIDRRYLESEERVKRIIKKYFRPFSSEDEVIFEWFSDATIEFFKSYSIEWISDLCYTKSELLKTKKENIFEHIKRRTSNNRNINADDKEPLVKNFIECLVHMKDSDLDAHLWEYGTSAFAANLVQSSIGADPISISAFKDSSCILDTNVLMNIGLEASEYHHALRKLEKIFISLNILPCFFKITEDEYLNAIAAKRTEILKTVAKFSFNVIKEVDDHFIQSAIKRKCFLFEDFERFCQDIATVPKRINESLNIEPVEESNDLKAEIDLAILDPEKNRILNEIFKKATGRDKRVNALSHDVGMIAGAEYSRKEEKAFILSQEISVNRYSHTKPTKNDLPLAIKLETLINMLAIDNGGVDVNPTDFSDLFADMIRYNLQPDKDTFEVADLSKLLDMELQIEQLPSDEVIKIASTLHQDRSKGLSDEEVSLKLNRQFQDTKLKFVEDYENSKESLSYERREKEISNLRLSKTEFALKTRIREEELKKYDNSVLKSRAIWFGLIPLGVLILTLIGIFIFNSAEERSELKNYGIGILVNVVFWLITSFFFTKPKLLKRNEVKKARIERIVDERFKNETS